MSCTKSKHNNNFIILPFAGYYNNGNYFGSSTNGKYWTSTLSCEHNGKAISVAMSPYGYQLSSEQRFLGLSIRPVYGEPTLPSMDFVSSVVIENIDLSIVEGSSLSLTATVLPETAYNKTVVWESSNDSIASVSQDGVVFAKDIGTVDIVATTVDGAKTDQCTINVQPMPKPSAQDVVDLGLSVKWAAYNVGASSPDEFGYRYAWGETVPIQSDDKLDVDYYKWFANGSALLIKYCTNPSYGFNGFTDNKIELEPEDDVAHLKWGGKWRIPKDSEIEELISECNCEYSSLNNVPGFILSSNKTGFENNWIFLPLSDSFNHYYWSSTSSGQTESLGLTQSNDGKELLRVWMYRSWCVMIRPVCD